MAKIKYRIAAKWIQRLAHLEDPYWYDIERYVGWSRFGFWWPLDRCYDQDTARSTLAARIKNATAKGENKIIAEVEIDA